MVAARYIEERYLNPLRAKRIKREEEAKKKDPRRGEGQGDWPSPKPAPKPSPSVTPNGGAWNERRLAAEAKGEPLRRAHARHTS